MSPTAPARVEPALSERCLGRLTGLVLRCGQGDEAALGDLFDLTFFLVATVVSGGAVRSIGPDAETLEAFRRIWRGAPGYRPAERGVLAWMVEQALAQPTGEPAVRLSA